MSGESSDLRARVLGAVAREAAPTRDATTRSRTRAFASGFGGALLLTSALGVHFGERPNGFVLLLALSWTAVAAFATWLLVSRGRSMLGRPRAVLIAGVGVALALLLAQLAVGYLVYPDAMHLECGERGHVICFVTTLVLAAGPLAAFAAVRRGGDVLHPALTGVAFAVASGAWACAAMLLHCPYSGWGHMAMGHLAPLVVLVALGATVTARIVTTRTTRAR